MRKKLIGMLYMAVFLLLGATIKADAELNNKDLVEKDITTVPSSMLYHKPVLHAETGSGRQTGAGLHEGSVGSHGPALRDRDKAADHDKDTDHDKRSGRRDRDEERLNSRRAIYYYPVYAYPFYDDYSYNSLQNGPRMLSLQEIAAMANRGSSDEEIIDEIKKWGQVYRLTMRDIEYLKQNGVRDKVIDYMRGTQK